MLLLAAVGLLILFYLFGLAEGTQLVRPDELTGRPTVLLPAPLH